MPEETTNQTTQTAESTANTASEPVAGTNATETAEKPQETAKTAQETQTVEQKPTEEAKPEEFTLDTYKDLLDSETIEEFELTEQNLQEFKELGVKNHIPKDHLKAIAQWSLENVKKQQEHAAKVVEGWRKQNQEKYGDNLKNVQTNVGRVLAEMDKSGQFASLLKDVGAEEHPATLEFLSAIGDVLLEKGSVNPNATVQGKEMSLEDMYKNNK